MPWMRLNDHTAHLMCLVGKLYEKGELTDCIVVTKDGSVNAHKLILAVYSPHLKQKLLNHDGKTSIAFKEVEHHIMKLILDLMYYGEANVPPADMALFTETANLFEIKSLSCASLNLSETVPVRNTSEDNGATSTCGVNLLKENEKNFHLLERGVMFNPDVIHETQGRSSSGIENIDMQSIYSPEIEQGIILKEFSEEVKEDQSKRSSQSSNDTAMDAMLSDEENSLDELHPFTFVAVKIEANDEGNNTGISDSQLENPLEELDCDASIEANKCPSEFQLKMEDEEVIDNNEEMKDLSSSWNAPLTKKPKQSFHDFSAKVVDDMLADRKGIDGVHDISVLNDNCDDEETEELNVKFEPICELSEFNLKEDMSCDAGLDFGDTEDINSPPLNQCSGAVKNEEDNLSLIACQQDQGLENACSSKFKLKEAIVVLTRIDSGSWKENGVNHSDRRNSCLVDNKQKNNFEIRLEEEKTLSAQCFSVLCPKNCDVECLEGNAVPPTAPQETYFNPNSHSGNNSFSSDICQPSISQNHFLAPPTGVNPFTCEFCYASFSLHTSLKIHLRTHPEYKPFSCEVCKSSFTDKTNLKKHLRIHSGYKPFSCDICNASFSRRCHLQDHLRTHTGEKPFTCDICNASYSRRDNLKEHLHKHTGDKPFSCDVCKCSFNSRKSLKVHLRRHTREKPFSCKVCNACFSDRDYLRNHLLTHTGYRPFSCSVCKARFLRKDHLGKHMVKHNGDKFFSCKMCNSCFSDRGNLETHLRIHTGDNPFTCDICNYSFTQRAHLQNHLRTHTGVNPFTCDICKKSYAQRDYLKDHLRTHTGDKPYTCHICNKSFHRGTYLRNHLRTHTGDKPFSCDICDSSFSQKVNLQNHLRTHTGDKPFTCDICNKSFSRKEYLKYHFLKHTEDNPFSCDVCKSSFSQRDDLMKHIRIHSEKVCTGDVCKTSFTGSNNLEVHLGNHTAE